MAKRAGFPMALQRTASRRPGSKVFAAVIQPPRRGTAIDDRAYVFGRLANVLSRSDREQAGRRETVSAFSVRAARFLEVLSVLALAAAPSVSAQSGPRVALLDTASLAAPRLVEGSGVAPSSRVPGIFWTHNDSGDQPFLYATDSAGHDLGRVRVTGGHARDWEDLATGSCVVAPGRCLYVADIGDNAEHRPYVVLYRVPEPVPPRGAADTLRTVAVLDSIVLRYPDRPHNAEALAVTATGEILLVTKELFRLPTIFRARANGPATQELERVAVLPIRSSLAAGRLVTGAAVSPNDSLLVVRTYVSLHFFRLRRNAPLVPLGGRGGVTIPFVEAQGEAVTFEAADRLVLISERGTSARGSICRLRLTVAP
jgi:hypothetical protein